MWAKNIFFFLREGKGEYGGEKRDAWIEGGLCGRVMQIFGKDSKTET